MDLNLFLLLEKKVGRRLTKKLPTILVITGPTGSGKTKLAHLISKIIPSELISADSRQIYKGLNIGTSKPTKSDIKNFNYHLIDIRNPDEKYSAGEFQIDGRKAISKIITKNKLPIVVGGTGLYIRALIDGLSENIESDLDLRLKFEEEIKEKGLNSLFLKLKKVDPKTAKVIDSKNPRRIIRALEVYYLTEKPISELHSEREKDNLFNPIFVGLNWERDKLYSRIDIRVEEMLENGFLLEVKNLLEKGFDDKLQSMQSVGYKEMLLHLKNPKEIVSQKLSYDEAVNEMKKNTRRFAKRQLTWFRKESRTNWINISDETEFENISKKVVENIMINR